MKISLLALIFYLLTACTFAYSWTNNPAKDVKSDPDALMLRFPDVSADEIVFVYAGDLWIVPREGGVARKLTSSRGSEQFPKFSPDGGRIAFSGNYDGNTDVYVISAEGGIPSRLTHHPDDDLVVDWHPDGDHILFRSNMLSPSNRFNRFFSQAVNGGMPEVLPLPYGEFGSFSPDGGQMAFDYYSPMRGVWKRYKGGMASDIWIYKFDDKSVKRLTSYEGTDFLPMWHGNKIYFLSDQGKAHRLNLWVHDLETEETKQITTFTDYDIRWSSLGPKDIVFENGGKLFLLHLADESISEVSVQAPYDLPEVRPRLKDLSRYIENFSVSPTGKRALFEARGEVVTVPAGEGAVRNLTETSGVAERFPVWSNDGKYIAYLSDKSGEYELYLRLSNGEGEETRITTDGGSFRYKPLWSPDSRKIAFSDKAGSLYIVDIDKGVPEFVDKDDHDKIDFYSWSPDSRWVAYTKKMPNGLKSVFLYGADTKNTHKVTTDFYNHNSPVFDPEGRYLYYYSDTSFKPVYGDMDDTWIYPNSTQIYAITLRKDIMSPLAPRDEEEYVSDNSGKISNGDNNKNKGGKVEIDFEGIEERAVKIPVGAGNFGSLSSVKGKIVYLRFPPAGVENHNGPGGTLQYFDLQDRREKTVIPKISDYAVSSSGEKVIYRSGDKFGIIGLAEGKKPGEGQINLSGMKFFIDPREEWRQIFNDAWRIQRDFFYDPNMHGVDWQGVKERYEKLLPFVVSRDDLNYVISEMMGELNSSHTYVSGGDIEEAERVSVGLLGADLELDEKREAYRIKRIYKGGELSADVYSPLGQPGVKVKEGEYLVAVNGNNLDASADPWKAFQGLEGETVTLTLGSEPDSKNPRQITVKLISSGEDKKLRYLDWIENNRKRVEEMTGGKVGYIYLPDTAWQGQNELVRQLTPQAGKEALIIDERFNGGGQVPDRFIEFLDRPTLNYWAVRDFKDWRTPTRSHTGPKAMIINGWAGSGGDALPYYFKKAGLGPLVGTRTMGGLIGIGGNPGLIDGGFVTAPTYAFWNSDGKWEVEGYGVDPDYEVDDLPGNLNETDDPQLDRAVEIILDLLEKNPRVKPERPVYEDRSGSD
ncbi:MAG: PDZ domain-containing protein [Deltaproteobacteria bacterium]